MHKLYGRCTRTKKCPSDLFHRRPFRCSRGITKYRTTWEGIDCSGNDELIHIVEIYAVSVNVWLVSEGQIIQPGSVTVDQAATE